VKQLNKYYKAAVGMEGYNGIFNTILFLKIILPLLDIEYKYMTNTGVERPIIKYKQMVE